jgi:hypothetical protein
MPLVGVCHWPLGLKECPSSEDFVSCNDFDHQGSQSSAPRRRTLSRATDFDRKGLNDLPLIGGLCLVQRTSTTKGLNDLPLVGGLYFVQWTSTARGLNDLPLIGGLCLVQRTSTTKGLNDLPLIGGLCLVPMTDFDHDWS